MDSVQQFNGLHGTTVSRAELRKIIRKARAEGQEIVAHRVQDLLARYPSETHFEIEIDQFEQTLATQGLAGVDFEDIPEEESVGLAGVSQNDVYNLVTKKILEMLKTAHASDYKKAWRDDEAFLIPLNFVTKKPYSGVNFLLLSTYENAFINGYVNPYFLTFKQITERKGKVKKGAKAQEVIYFSPIYFIKAKTKNDNPYFKTKNHPEAVKFCEKYGIDPKAIKRYGVLKYYNVFNGNDVEGIDFELIKTDIVGRVTPEDKDNDIAELLLKHFPQKPEIFHKGNRAFYELTQDIITLPKKANFNTPNDYYRTLFHECTHATGHQKRLNRDLTGNFGTKKYAFEELIAEFGAVFLSAQAGILWYRNKNHSGYLKSWLQKFDGKDNKILMNAAAQAQKSTDYILNKNDKGEPAFYKDIEKNVINQSNTYEKSKRNKKTTKSSKANGKCDTNASNATDNSTDATQINGKNCKVDKVQGKNTNGVENFSKSNANSSAKNAKKRAFRIKKIETYIYLTNYVKYMIGKDYYFFTSSRNGDTLVELKDNTYFSREVIELTRLGRNGELWTVKKNGTNYPLIKPTEAFYTAYAKLENNNLITPELIRSGKQEKKPSAGENKPQNRPKTQVTLLKSDEKASGGADFVKKLVSQKPALKNLDWDGVLNPYEFDYKLTKLPTEQGIFKLKSVPEKYNYIFQYALVTEKSYVATDKFMLAIMQREKNDGYKTDDLVSVASNHKTIRNGENDIKYPNYKSIIPKAEDYIATAEITVDELVQYTANYEKIRKVLKCSDSDDKNAADKVFLHFHDRKSKAEVAATSLKNMVKIMRLFQAENENHIKLVVAKNILGFFGKSMQLWAMRAIFAEDYKTKVVPFAVDFKHLKTNGLGKPQMPTLFEGLGLPTAQNSDTTAFNKAILKAKREGVQENKVYNLGKSKGALKKIIGEHNITISGKVIKKAIEKDADHIATFENFINLPDFINNPVAIFKSKTQPQSKVILTQIKTYKEKPLMVAMHLNSTFKISKIASVYSKTQNSIYKKWYNEGLCEYYINKKTLNELLPGLIPISHAVKRLGKNKTKISKKQEKGEKIRKSNKKGLHAPASVSIFDRINNPKTTDFEHFNIANPDMSHFLGKLERKGRESLVVTIGGAAGSGKTRFAFQFINALAQFYKVGHASMEEHPESKLYFDKVRQYLNNQAMQNTTAPEILNINDLEALIRNNDVVVIDSFEKLREVDPAFGLDKDLRKKYDGKLFLIVYQLTTTGRMRGGSKSEYDGDIILKVQDFDDYRENFVYPQKNRYNHLPASALQYNIYTQTLSGEAPEETPSTESIDIFV